MRKSTVFISAVLTTFALLVLYRIASAYNENQNATETAGEATATQAATATEPAAPTKAAIGPEEAAEIASQVVGKTNLLSAESSSFNGVDAYLITFTNKDVVYVGLDGQVLAVQVSPVVIQAAPPEKRKNKNNGGGQTINSAPAPAPAAGENHEDEDHEEEHDD